MTLLHPEEGPEDGGDRWCDEVHSGSKRWCTEVPRAPLYVQDLKPGWQSVVQYVEGDFDSFEDRVKKQKLTQEAVVKRKEEVAPRLVPWADCG